MKDAFLGNIPESYLFRSFKRTVNLLGLEMDKEEGYMFDEKILELVLAGHMMALSMRERGFVDVCAGMMAIGIKMTFAHEKRSAKELYDFYRREYPQSVEEWRREFGDPADLVDAVRMEL